MGCNHFDPCVEGEPELPGIAQFLILLLENWNGMFRSGVGEEGKIFSGEFFIEPSVFVVGRIDDVRIRDPFHEDCPAFDPPVNLLGSSFFAAIWMNGCTEKHFLIVLCHLHNIFVGSYHVALFLIDFTIFFVDRIKGQKHAKIHTGCIVEPFNQGRPYRLVMVF